MTDITQRVLTPRRLATQQAIGAYVRQSMMAEHKDPSFVICKCAWSKVPNKEVK